MWSTAGVINKLLLHQQQLPGQVDTSWSWRGLIGQGDPSDNSFQLNNCKTQAQK